MASGVSPDKQLEVLHDHYKESFSLILDRERSRNRLFLILIGLYALLAVEVQYPTQFDGSVESLSVAGAGFDVGALPLPALLNATWVLTLALALRYCMISVTINRSYAYLHKLEDDISPLFNGDHRYRREGKEYTDKYPRILNVGWIAYVFVFPIILASATVWLLMVEWWSLSYPLLHRLLDTGVGLSTAAVVLLYFTEPWVYDKWPQTRERIGILRDGLVMRFRQRPVVSSLLGCGLAIVILVMVWAALR